MEEVKGPEGKSWHKTCFTCADCGKSMTASTWREGNDMVYCSICYPKYFPTAGFQVGRGSFSLSPSGASTAPVPTRSPSETRRPSKSTTEGVPGLARPLTEAPPNRKPVKGGPPPVINIYSVRKDSEDAPVPDHVPERRPSKVAAPAPVINIIPVQTTSDAGLDQDEKPAASEKVITSDEKSCSRSEVSKTVQVIKKAGDSDAPPASALVKKPTLGSLKLEKPPSVAMRRNSHAVCAPPGRQVETYDDKLRNFARSRSCSVPSDVLAAQFSAAAAAAAAAAKAKMAGLFPCDEYRLDLLGENFGDCKCGFPKVEHSAEALSRKKTVLNKANQLAKSGSVPCSSYQVDLYGATDGDCKCGFPRSAHSRARMDVAGTASQPRLQSVQSGF
uniref:LIM zinc-binding domain-containing protein n=1 Tax=Noctiluca scintillans TaxID=2966 RepID=A0A7S1AKE4_NOCSC